MPVITLPLTPNGPIIAVGINISMPKSAALQKAGLPPPKPFVGLGLIDTGASCTAIDASIATALGLVPTGIAQVHTPSTGSSPHQCNEYDVSAWFIENQMPAATAQPATNFHPIHITLPVIESNFAAQGFHALIGRDCLAKCHLVYDGKNNSFSLTYGQ